MKGKPCEVTNCRISYDTRDLDKSDAVLFHGFDMRFDISKLSKSVKNRAKQRWVFFLHESQVNFKRLIVKDLRKLEDVFNWTMTFKYDSDIFRHPYRHYFRKTGLENHVQKESPKLW